MTSQYPKLLLLTLTLLSSLPSAPAHIDAPPATANDAPPPATANSAPPPATANGAPPQESAAMAKLNPFEKEMIKIKTINNKWTPQQQDCEAEFLFKLKTGAPLSPAEQARAALLSPEDIEFFQNGLKQFDTNSPTAATPPPPATTPATPPVAAQNSGGTSAMAKLSPFEKQMVALKAAKENLSPEEQELEAQFVIKMKTGAALTPAEQERADKLRPEDKKFFQEELKKYDSMTEQDAEDAFKTVRGQIEAQKAAGGQQ